MSSLYSVPTFASGFARNASQALFPNLWKGLVGLWAPGLGVQGNRLFDFSGFRNDGILTNMTNDNWVLGRDGWGLGFNGIDEIINAGNDSSLNANHFTVATRLKVNVFQDLFDTPLAKPDSGSDFDLILWPTTNKVRFFFSTDGVTPGNVESSIALSVNTWHYIVVTYDGVALKIFIDGIERGSTPGTGNRVTNSKDLIFGDHEAPLIDRFFNGVIGEALFYNGACSFQEIAILSAVPNAPLILKDDLMAFLVAGRLSRYHNLSGLGAQGQMTWNPLG